MQESHDEESLLWKEFKKGDREAFALLYQKHIIPLIAYGSKICSDRDLLKDQIQELFIELWNSRRNLADTDSVRYYLLKALRYKLIRQEKRHHSQENALQINDLQIDGEIEAPIETAIMEKEILESYRSLLKKALGHLTQRQQEIIQLRYYQGLTHEQIAKLMDMNYQSVSNLLHKALFRLKEQMKIPVLAFVFLFVHPL